MSEMEQATAFNAAQQKRGRMIFLLLAIFFSVPVIVVVTMIKLDWRPAGKSYGELIQPAISIAHSSHWHTDKQQAAEQFWQDKWSMVYVTHHCDAPCMARMHDIRQIYVSLYKDMVRVQRVLLTEEQDTAAIRANYPDMLIINGQGQSLTDLAQLLSNGGQATMDANRVYLIDPLGNVMMQYSPQIEAKWIRKDLMKLLKSSWAG